MDLFVQKARIFAQETAKKSQEIAIEAAKLSQELALETAKRSREISHDFVVEATKKADQIKTLASELSPGMGIVVRGGGTSDAPLQPSEKELEDYGITPELREFVKGLTIRTFRDFPLEDSNCMEKTEKAAVNVPQVRQDLTEWQERHAVLVLMTVPEISDFRYVLCPRRMRESKFWKIYFILVQTHIAPYEARAAERAKAEEEALSNAAVAEELSRSLSSTSLHRAATGNEEKNATAAKAVKSANADNDLDAYLMGALGSDEEEAGFADGDDEGFDADFDKLVNSAPLDSDGEDPADRDTSTTASSKHGGQSGPKKPMGKTSAIACESSSDGELVEIPEQ